MFPANETQGQSHPDDRRLKGGSQPSENNSPVDLNELIGQSGLSNKKWDKSIKGLTKNNLARVEKTEEDLLVSVV